jgi:Ubiquitin 3 binding protein But2 C-terminal domain
MRLILTILAALLGCTAATPLRPLSIISSRQLGTCPPNGNLPPTYLSPTLMVPVSKNLPDVAFGSTRTPLITPGDFCTIFNLVIPPSAEGDTCTLEFLFPDHEQTLSPYGYNGGGHFTFTGYAFGSGATEQTTYNNQPPAGPSPPEPPAVLSPGNAYTVNVGPCGVQAPASLEVSGMLCSDDTTFSYLQTSGDELGCPIGFFVGIS